eukprot:tig00021366_g20839.t1
MERLADRTMSGGGDAHAQARPPALNIAGLVGGSALSSSGRLEKLRQLINGALFYLTDKTGKNYDVLFSVVWPTVAVVLDACQLVGLAMTPEWHSPSVSWLQVGLDFYVQFQRANFAFVFLYWAVIAVLGLTFALTPLSADVTARTHGRVHLAYVAVQSVLVFVGPPLRERQSFLFLLLVSSACFLMSSLFVVLQPHYHRPMNMLRAGCFAAAGTFAIGSLEGIEAAEAIFEAGLARFKTSAYVALHYAVFLSTFKKEQQLATHRLRMAERLPRVGLDVGFLLQAKRRAIVQMDQSKSLGEDAGLSVVAFLEFQQTLEDATKHQNMALQEIRSFWRNMQRLSNSLTWEGARTERRPGALGGRLQAGPRRNGNGGRRGAMNEPNGAGLASLVAISGLEQRLATIEKSKLRTEGAYQRLISKFPRSPALCRAYAYFKAEVCNQHADAAIYHARADEIEDAEAMALALAGPQGAGSAGGGSATNDNDAGQDDRDTGSVLSKSFKKQRDRSDPAAALLEAAAMKGARAVRMLQRGIVVGCWLLLILLVALCSTSIDRLQDQHGAMDRFVSVSFIRTSIARTVDSVRSVSLAARAASVDGLAAASAAAQERARAILVRSRELYYAGDRAAASWSSIRFDAPLYIAPLPASTAAAAAASTSTSNASRSDGATVAMTSMSTLDGVLVFVDRVGAVASAPAKAVPVDPAFRYVCDAGLGSLASAMQRLGGVYEEAFALDLNALYVRYAALTAAYVAVAIFSGVFVSVGLTNVSRDKINLADVVVKIPKTLIKSVVKHYEAVKIITSDTEEERGDRTHRGLDSQRSFEMEGLSSREHDAYTYAARAGRGRRRSAARSVAGSVEDGDGERVGRRRSVDRSAAGAGRGAGLGFANIVSLAIAKRKVEEARLIPAPSGSLDAGAHGHGQDQPKRDVDAPLGARDGGIASGDDGTGAGLRLTLDRMKSFAMAQRQEKEKETQQGKAADGTDPEPGPMNFAPAAVSAAGAAGSSSSAQPQPQPVAVTAVAPFRLDPFTVDVFSLGEDAPRLSGPVAVSLMDDDDFAPNGSGSSLSSDPRDRDPERKGSGTGPGDGEAQLRMQPVALIPSMALITSPSVQRDLESGLKADAFPAAVDVDAAAPAASAIIDVRRDTQAEPKGTSTVLAGSELTSPTEASATGTSRWLLPVVLETKGRDVAADDSAPGKGLLRRAASIRVAPLPTANVAGGAAGDREDARGWTNFSAVSRRALAVVRTVRFRVWACLFAISLIAVATFLVCFFLAGQTRGAVDELAAVGRVAHALADLHALSRDLYLEAALSVLKANGLLDAAGALVAPGAGAVPGSNQAGGRLEGWEDGASFGDPFLLTVRAELPSLLGAFDRVTDTIIAHVDSSVAWLRSVLAAVLVADALAIALISPFLTVYALVFGPMLRRLREESSRAAQLLRMIPGGLLASAQLSIRDLLPTSWHTPKK